MSNPGAASTTTATFVGGGSPFWVADDPADTVGFYGTTPVVQRATAASHTTIATTVAVSTTSAIWGFSTSTQANNAIAAIAEIQATLVAIGIWAA
jgi:UDP-N-acetyl-D-mannosaminuronic acid transferase (WecB/TagA/CpsF family)